MKTNHKDFPKGDWMTTFTGKKFYINDPDPNLIDILDITHALSNICRFTGHTNRFYSVAEHSLVVSGIAEIEGESPIVQLSYLMHDFHEAYIGDISTPLNNTLKCITGLDILGGIKDNIDKAITERFGIELDHGYKDTDIATCLAEKEGLITSSSHEWDLTKQGYLPHKSLPTYFFHSNIYQVNPRQQLLDRFLQLMLIVNPKKI